MGGFELHAVCMRNRCPNSDSATAAGAGHTWYSERKTGVKHAEVVTARLVQDERGWLRLAG